MSNSLLRENNMSPKDGEWLKTSEEKQQEARLAYIKSMQSHIPNRCKHCGTLLTIDEEQIYCSECGLIHQDSTMFNGGIKITLIYGLRLG